MCTHTLFLKLNAIVAAVVVAATRYVQIQDCWCFVVVVVGLIKTVVMVLFDSKVWLVVLLLLMMLLAKTRAILDLLCGGCVVVLAKVSPECHVLYTRIMLVVWTRDFWFDGWWVHVIVIWRCRMVWLLRCENLLRNFTVRSVLCMFTAV